MEYKIGDIVEVMYCDNMTNVFYGKVVKLFSKADSTHNVMLVQMIAGVDHVLIDNGPIVECDNIYVTPIKESLVAHLRELKREQDDILALWHAYGDKQIDLWNEVQS